MFLFSFGIQISQITELNLLDSFLHIFHEVRVCVFCGAFVAIPTERKRKKITAARHFCRRRCRQEAAKFCMYCDIVLDNAMLPLKKKKPYKICSMLHNETAPAPAQNA